MVYFLSEVFQSLKSHKWRSVFTGFGVMWSLLILVLLLGGGAGFRKGVMKSFSQYGENKLYVYTGWTPSGQVSFTLPILKELDNKFPFIRYLSPIVQTCQFIQCRDTEIGRDQTFFLGVNTVYDKIANLSCIAGRFFTEGDDERGHPVCIIGSQIKQQFKKKKILLVPIYFPMVLALK